LGAIFRDSETGSLKYGAFQTTQFDQAISSVRTASYVFNSPLNLKKVKFIDAMFDRVNGPLEVWFRWRFEGSSTWYTSLVRRFNGINGVTGFFRVPVDEIDDAGFTVQFAVEWRGVARLKLAIFTAALIDRYTGEINDCGVQQLVTQENDDLDFGCPQLPIGVET
jgi:hypothetical protein